MENTLLIAMFVVSCGCWVFLIHFYSFEVIRKVLKNLGSRVEKFNDGESVAIADVT